MAVMNYGKCMVTGTNSELLLYYEIDSSSITEKITNKTTLIPSTGIEKLDAPYASGIGIRNSNISFYYLDVNERNQINYLKNSDKWSHGAWINLSKLGVDSYYRNIFMMFRATADIQILSIRQDDPVNPIIFSTFAVKEQVLGNVNVKVDSINVWNHVLFIRNGTELKGYVNGVLQSTMSCAMNKFTTIDFANQRLFGDGYTGSRYANAGYMAQYFLARGVLTDNQIKSIYNSGAGNPDLRTIIH